MLYLRRGGGASRPSRPNTYDGQSLDMIEVRSVLGYERKIPLFRGGRDPGVRGRDSTPDRFTVSHDFAPVQASTVIRVKCQAEFHVSKQQAFPLHPPVILAGPKQELGSRHERDVELEALDDPRAGRELRVIGLEENGHYVRVQQANSHSESGGLGVS